MRTPTVRKNSPCPLPLGPEPAGPRRRRRAPHRCRQRHRRRVGRTTRPGGRRGHAYHPGTGPAVARSSLLAAVWLVSSPKYACGRQAPARRTLRAATAVVARIPRRRGARARADWTRVAPTMVARSIWARRTGMRYSSLSASHTGPLGRPPNLLPTSRSAARRHATRSSGHARRSEKPAGWGSPPG